MGFQYFSGFETGDSSEWTTVSGTTAIVTSPLHGGGYAGKVTSTGTASFFNYTALSAGPQFCARCYIQVHVTTPPSVASARGYFAFLSAAGASLFAVYVNTDTSGNLVFDLENEAVGQVGSTYPISADTWYLLELKALVSTTAGALEMRVNGAVVASGSNLNTGSTNIAQLRCRCWQDTGSIFALYDDVAVSDSGYIGPGQCIARQGLAGTPTYDTFTKVVGATANECWSETPYSATKACTSITNGGAQTMLTESFANLQSGHGTEKFWTGKGLTINACKVAMIAKVATGSSHSIRRRLNSVNTDTAKTLTTADAYYDDGIWSDTFDNINSMEIGVLHGADVNLVTIEDMWIMMDVDKFWILGPH